MNDIYKKIRLFGNEYILIGDLETGGTICTEQQLENFEVSFAKLVSDGRIMRYKKQIGTREDIAVIGEWQDDIEELTDELYDNLATALLSPADWVWQTGS